jgi:hypothetical protein
MLGYLLHRDLQRSRWRAALCISPSPAICRALLEPAAVLFRISSASGFPFVCGILFGHGVSLLRSSATNRNLTSARNICQRTHLPSMNPSDDLTICVGNFFQKPFDQVFYGVSEGAGADVRLPAIHCESFRFQPPPSARYKLTRATLRPRS